MKQVKQSKQRFQQKLHKEMVAEEKAVTKVQKQFHAQELKTSGAIPARSRQRRVKRVVNPITAIVPFRGKLKDVAPAFDPEPDLPPTQFYHTEPGLAAQPKLLTGRNEAWMATGMAPSRGLITGNKYVDAMVQGYGTTSSRMPDPYTCVKTFPVVTHANATISPLFPSSGTLTYGGSGFVVMGSGVASYAQPTLTQGAGVVGIDWTTFTGLSNTGINNTYLLSRPMGKNDTFTFNLVGPKHSVTMCAIPVMPKDLSVAWSSSAVLSFPTTCNLGLTTINSLWGGRSWQADPGDSVTLISAPLDNRSFDFEASAAARGSYDALGQIAWSGWVVWFWGLTVGDTVLYRSQMAEECAYAPYGALNMNYPQSRNPPNPMASATAKNLFAMLMEKGYGAVKYAADAIAPMAARAFDAFVRPSRAAILGVGPDTNPTGFMSSAQPITRQSLPPLAVLPTDKCDEKTDDQLEIVTPKNARRPSLALSLSARKK